MNTMHAAYRLVNEFPGGAVALAPVVNKNAATLSHEVNPNYPTAKFGLADAVALTMWTRDLRIPTAFAAEVGCLLVPLPDAEISGDSFATLAKLARDFSNLVTAVTDAAADRTVTPNELRTVQDKAAHLVASVQATVQHMAAMQPQPLRAEEVATA